MKGSRGEGGLLGQRRRFLGYLENKFPTLAAETLGTQVGWRSVRISLPEEWRPSDDDFKAAAAGLRSRRSQTGWRQPEEQELEEYFARLLHDWNDSPRKDEDVPEEIRALFRESAREGLVEVCGTLLERLKDADFAERDLLFSEDTTLVACMPDETSPQLRFLARTSGNGDKPELLPLSGEAPAIHSWNAKRAADGQVVVDAEKPQAVEDYLRFFCHHIAGSEGYFVIVESVDEVVDAWTQSPMQELKDRDTEPLLRFVHREERDPYKDFLKSLGRRVFPITRLPEESSKGTTRLCASVLYDWSLFHAGFTVDDRGFVEMIVDQPVEFRRYPLRVGLPLDPLRAAHTLKDVVDVPQGTARRTR